MTELYEPMSAQSLWEQYGWMVNQRCPICGYNPVMLRALAEGRGPVWGWMREQVADAKDHLDTMAAALLASFEARPVYGDGTLSGERVLRWQQT